MKIDLKFDQAFGFGSLVFGSIPITMEAGNPEEFDAIALRLFMQICGAATEYRKRHSAWANSGLGLWEHGHE